MDSVWNKITRNSSQNLLQAFYVLGFVQFRLVPETGTSRFVENEQIIYHIIEIVALSLILYMFYPKRGGRSFYDKVTEVNANCCTR